MANPIGVTAAALETIHADCRQRYPHETCGIMAGPPRDRPTVTEVRPIRNLNTERAADRYILDPAEHNAVDQDLRQRRMETIGIYHSHPDHPAQPSRFDLDRALEIVEAFGDNTYVYIIVAVAQGTVERTTAWVLNEARTDFVEADIVAA